MSNKAAENVANWVRSHGNKANIRKDGDAFVVDIEFPYVSATSIETLTETAANMRDARDYMGY